MKKSTRGFCWAQLFGMLLCLLCLSQLSNAQQAQRPGPDDPSQSCSRVYYQRDGATYLAANHLSGSYGPADIGTTGATTIIDVGAAYGGTVVFNGLYHVRGNVRFINGNVSLLPGTIFYVEGLSGQSTTPSTIYYPLQFIGIGLETSTFIEIDNANLVLTGASIIAACQRTWGGINLLDNGRIRTLPDPDATILAGRCVIRDAFIGINATAQSGQFSTAEYYLNNTDFINNYTSVYDYYKAVARAGEGMHYCTFSTDAGLKAPLNTFGNGFNGIWLGPFDRAIGYNNYAAASIDHCSFHHLDNGIYGEGEQLRIRNNTFDYIWYAAINQEQAQAMFDMKPMTVEHNDIMIRGTNPHGHSTTWGIYGSPYTTGNYIHGDDANPAGNSVQQIGMFMGVPDNSTQSDNTFERLDKGIEASVDYSGTRERDISGNLFRDVVAGISFYTYIAGAMSPSRLFVRCNSFENPGSLAGAVALNMEGPNFSSALGSSVTGNGNRFVTTGLPFIEPIINVAAPFIYYAFNGSAQENFSLATSAGYSVALTGGSLSTACSGAGYSNGINNRSATTASISSEELQHAYDSLRLKDIGAARRYALMNTLVTVAEQRKDFTTLEAYMATLPDFANEVHKSLGSWLLHAYYTEHRPADAQRMQAVLLARHPADPEARSFVLLTDALLRISRPAAPLDPAAVAALRQVAASGTPSARVACPIARLYDPTCPCHFSAKGASTALAAPDVAGSMNSLGMGTPYPNPANESISIPYTVPVGQGSVQLELHNALGQLVYRMPLSQGMDEAKITIGQLASGLYQVVLVSNGQHVVTRRLAVAH